MGDDKATAASPAAGFDSPVGPYVPPDGDHLEATLIVKAGPERSKKYGETVCTACILDDGRLVRVYPVPVDEYWQKEVHKYDRVRMTVHPSDERANRPESHHLDSGLDVIGSDLRGSPAPWDERMNLMGPAIEPQGIQGLRDEQAENRKSLGIVKVRELLDFWISAPLDDIIEQADYRESGQKTLFGEDVMEGNRVDKVKHVFRYKWRCTGTCCDEGTDKQGFHDTTCEDWEMFESFRSWRKIYKTDEEFVEKFKRQFFDSMGQSDLHFAMGTPSDPARQNSWMIIGLIYPGKPKTPKDGVPTLCASDLPGDEVVRPNAEYDDEPNIDGAEAPVEQEPVGLFKYG